MDDFQATLVPLEGGHSGRTFLSQAAGERVVVRIYPPDDLRGPLACEVDAALLELVAGLVPVPAVVQTTRPDPDPDRPGLLVTQWLPGERGDLVFARLQAGRDEEGLARLGAALGTLAGTLAGMPMRRVGTFLGADLAIEDFGDLDLVSWARTRLREWPEEVLAGLLDVADHAQRRLDGLRRACLVHSDLNPKNVLVDPISLEITGLVDWEYAHAGHPWTDVGNLLRFERHPGYVAAVLQAWTRLRGGEPDVLLDGARSADLWALVDLAARAGQNPVADRAEVLLRAIATSRDVHAWPRDWNTS